MSTSRLNTAFLLSITSLWAHPTFVYTNNNGSPNTVSAFSVGVNGALTPVPGSPFPTGGTGGPSATGSTQIITTLAKHFVYVTNAGSLTISAFSIDPSTGKLTLVPGAPFPSGVGGIGGLAITPDDKYLIITNGSLANIAVNSIGTNGTLTPVPGSPFFGTQAFVQTADPKVTPDGKFLAVSSVTNIGAGVVAMFNISSAGAVSHGSLPTNAGADTGIDCDCASSRLYAGSGRVKLVNGMLVPNPAVDGYTITNGVLAPLAGSPFFAPGGLDVLLSPDGTKLFSSGLSSDISVFNVAPNGALSAIPGSPFPAGLGVDSIAIDDSGKFIYFADVTSHKVGVLHIAANGALTPVPGSPFPSGSLDGPVGVTVYPPKTCCPAPKLHEVSASPRVLRLSVRSSR
jgi:6-phosphogluconolactonase